MSQWTSSLPDNAPFPLSCRRQRYPVVVFTGLRLCSGVPRSVQECGLQSHFMKDTRTHKFVKKLLALPYLPAAVIAATFDELIATVQLTDSLQQLVDCVRRQWIDGRFPPTNWSVYMKTIRTNNDTRGRRRGTTANWTTISTRCRSISWSRSFVMRPRTSPSRPRYVRSQGETTTAEEILNRQGPSVHRLRSVKRRG